MPRLLAEEVSSRIYLGEVAYGDAVWDALRDSHGHEDFNILDRLGEAGDKGLPAGRFSKHRFEVASLIAAGFVDYSEEGNRLYITHDEGRNALRCFKKMYTVNYKRWAE